MLDKELFGQSFLDGRDETNGRFYAADTGTLFLDNIEQTSLRLQEKLLRAIEYGQYEAGLETESQDVFTFRHYAYDPMTFPHSSVFLDAR